MGQIFGIIAQALMDFEDSHTFFLPPDRATRVDYGWRMQAYGDKCYVTAIKPGSDAEAKGLKLGYQVLMVNGFKTSRDLIWKMNYLFYALRPTPTMKVVVQKSDGSQHEIEFAAKITQGKRLIDLTGHDGGGDIGNYIREIEAGDHLRRHITIGEKVMVWKLITGITRNQIGAPAAPEIGGGQRLDRVREAHSFALSESALAASGQDRHVRGPCLLHGEIPKKITPIPTPLRCVAPLSTRRP